MITLTTSEIQHWLLAFFFPLARVLAVLAAAPPFNNPGLTVRVRMVIGLAVTFAITPALPAIPHIDPGSGLGLLVFAQQLLIGFAIGFSMRLVFSAVDLAGEVISLQMGLGFASSYDPQSAGQTGVVSEFLGLLALLVFMAINGHLMVIATLTKSFSVIPIRTFSTNAGTWWEVTRAGGIIFSSGLLLSLPMLIALMITNLALAILSRAAPQLNLMAIGFPLTLALGLAALMFGLSYLSMPLQRLFEYGLESMLGHFAGRV